MPAADYRPALDRVGALLRARTVAGMAGEQGTFTAATRPTDEQAELLIDQALSEVSVRIGADLPEALWASAASVVALRAAMLVELSYFPEQIGTNRPSPYEALRDLYTAEAASLAVAAREVGGGDLAGTIDDAKLPRFSRRPYLPGPGPYCDGVLRDGEAYLRRHYWPWG